MNNRKNVTENDVKEVFLTLMEENDETTSKEVKEELRDQGFWATQTEVSSIIRTNYKNWEEDTSIIRSFVNDHFVYFLGVVDDNKDTDDAQDFLLNKSKLSHTSDVNGGGYASLASKLNTGNSCPNYSPITNTTVQPKPKKGKFIKVEEIEADLFKVTVSILGKHYDIVVAKSDIDADNTYDFDFEDYDFKYRVVSKESDEDVYEYEIYVPNDYNISFTTNQARYYAWIVENRFGNKDIEYFDFRIKK